MSKEAENILRHKMAYLAFKGGMRTEEISTRLGVSSTTIISWRSANAIKCSCPWHNWNLLTTIDTPVNHRRAFALASTGHSNQEIGLGLGVPPELVEEWGIKSYPCGCGCHDWSIDNTAVDKAPIADLINVENEMPTSIVQTPINIPVEDAQTSTLHVTLNALSMAIQKNEVVPRSWKDVLDTLKTVSEIVKDLSPSVPAISPEKVAKFSRTESFEIPGGSPTDVSEKTIALATQLKKVAIGSVVK